MPIKKVTFQEDWLQHQKEVDFYEPDTSLAREILEYYETHTAKETAEQFGFEPEPKVVKRLHRLLPKNMGLGGKRKGAGNKKGIKFCKECRKAEKNCKCK